MRLAVADTGPINYLVQINRIELLSRLFRTVTIPHSVRTELAHPLAPLSVRTWLVDPPAWLELHETPDSLIDIGLDQGETAAIALAESLGADILLMDDREGVLVARQKGIRVTGTLGLLDLAADLGLIVFSEAIRDLKETTFRRPNGLLEALLSKHQALNTPGS